MQVDDGVERQTVKNFRQNCSTGSAYSNIVGNNVNDNISSISRMIFVTSLLPIFAKLRRNTRIVICFIPFGGEFYVVFIHRKL